jgi:hypothetical protein
MMSESSADTEKREEAFRMYNACKEALNIIGRFFFLFLIIFFTKQFSFLQVTYQLKPLPKEMWQQLFHQMRKNPVLCSKERKKSMLFQARVLLE